MCDNSLQAVSTGMDAVYNAAVHFCACCLDEYHLQPGASRCKQPADRGDWLPPIRVASNLELSDGRWPRSRRCHICPTHQRHAHSFYAMSTYKRAPQQRTWSATKELTTVTRAPLLMMTVTVSTAPASPLICMSNRVLRPSARHPGMSRVCVLAVPGRPLYTLSGYFQCTVPSSRRL